MAFLLRFLCLSVALLGSFGAWPNDHQFIKRLARDAALVQPPALPRTSSGGQQLTMQDFGRELGYSNQPAPAPAPAYQRETAARPSYQPHSHPRTGPVGPSRSVASVPVSNRAVQNLPDWVTQQGSAVAVDPAYSTQFGNGISAQNLPAWAVSGRSPYLKSRGSYSSTRNSYAPLGSQNLPTAVIDAPPEEPVVDGSVDDNEPDEAAPLLMDPAFRAKPLPRAPPEPLPRAPAKPLPHQKPQQLPGWGFG